MLSREVISCPANVLQSHNSLRVGQDSKWAGKDLAHFEGLGNMILGKAENELQFGSATWNLTHSVQICDQSTDNEGWAKCGHGQ